VAFSFPHTSHQLVGSDATADSVLLAKFFLRLSELARSASCIVVGRATVTLLNKNTFGLQASKATETHRHLESLAFVPFLALSFASGCGSVACFWAFRFFSLQRQAFQAHSEAVGVWCGWFLLGRFHSSNFTLGFVPNTIFVGCRCRQFFDSIRADWAFVCRTLLDIFCSTDSALSEEGDLLASVPGAIGLFLSTFFTVGASVVARVSNHNWSGTIGFDINCFLLALACV
jgi:hypothetical protein